MIPLLLLLIPTLAFGIALGPEPIHFPLSRRSLATRDLDFWAKAADHLRAKYGYNVIQRRQSSSAVPITNQVHSSFNRLCS